MFTTTTTTSTLRRSLAPLAVAALLLTACGGSDDDGASEPAPEADGSDDADASADEAAGDQSSQSSGDDGDDDGDGGSDDVTGEGSNDETQEGLDEVGVDLDLDQLEETATALSTGEGGGVVTVNGDAYTFEAQICIAQGPAFVAEGPSEAPDGTPAWVSVSYANDFDLNGDGTNEETVDVFVEVGKSELFGSGPDDQPDWAASSFDLASETADGLSVNFAGESISGGGPMFDFNYVAIAPGETVDMTFEASCS